MTKQTAIYARVSTDDQAERGYSLPSQIEACSNLATQKGWNIASVYADDISGAMPFCNRPEGSQLQQAIDMHLIRAVILIVLTSCSPYAAMPATATPSTTATGTAPAATVTASTTPRPSCVIETGYDAGRVNLRRAATRNSAALDVLHEGERVTVLHAGQWMNVQTREGLAGFIYSRYCK